MTLSEDHLHIRADRYLSRRPWIFDGLFLALPLALLSVPFTLATESVDVAADYGATDFTTPAWISVVLTLAMCLPLTFRRTHPEISTGVIAGAAALQVLTMAGPNLSAVAVPIALYSCAKYASVRVSRIFLVVGLFGAFLFGAYFYLRFLTAVLHDGSSALGPEVYVFIVVLISLAAAIVLVAWLFGDLAGRRRREVEAIAQRNALLEREREHESQLAADAERMRIAREMHDVISHSMSSMIAQADGGRYVIDADPSMAKEAFATISRTGREALSQMRSMLGVLREEGTANEVSPMPGLADLSQLLADVRATGLPVELVGDPTSLPRLPESLELAAYRIVQEALTNTMKHAGRGARATVRIEEKGAELHLGIDDTGHGSAVVGDGAGSGLLGMAERAKIHGGTVTTKGDASGFHVSAIFPLP